MPSLPSSLALTTIADGALMVASDERNNFTAIQTALNSLIATLAAGASGQALQSGGGTTVQWGPAVQSYTPTWSGTVSNPVIGNGTIVGEYVQIGKLVVADVKITMGSTTTFGSGVWSVSLPVTPLPGTSQIGSGMYSDSSAAASYPALWQAFLYTPSLPIATVSSAAPFAWATTDTVWLTIAYMGA